MTIARPLTPEFRNLAAALLLTCCLATVAWGSTPEDSSSPEDLIARGQQIFEQSCIDCHGPNGAGTPDAYEEPLLGDASIGELTEIVATTMPEGDPEACVAEDAAAVAVYMFESFYGEAAQLRRRPPRQVLQRLTATQLRQSLSDLYAAPQGVVDTKWESVLQKQGLRSSYFTGSRWEDEARKIERIDPALDFDWGHEGPGQGIDPVEFHAHWSGGLRAPQTGRYEIIVESTCSFEMNFGDSGVTLIDNNVQSEGRDEFRRFVTLTGGRIYPLKIDLKQRKRSTEQPPASLRLSWVRPGAVQCVIPAANLYCDWCPPSMLLQSQSPPDDRSYGFERGLTIDAGWDDSVTAAAFELADHLIEASWPSAVREAKKNEIERSEALRDFLTPIVAAANRTDAAGAAPILDLAVAGTSDEKEIIKKAILLSVKSPRFLYPQLDADRSISRQVADRLSLVLHDSLPVEGMLVDLIEKNQLADPGQLDWVIDRMIDDGRTRAKVRDMFTQWLELDRHEDLRKNSDTFVGFDEQVIADLRGSLETFIDATLWSDGSDFRQLLLADSMPTTQRLADYYGGPWQPTETVVLPGSRFFRSGAEPNVHVGLLTHPLVMSSLAYFDETSPIHRGVFLIRHVMGRTLRPPNSAFTPFAAELHPSLTTRARVELQTGDDNCQVCHRRINGLGFALEQFDATGRFRSDERDQPIDPSGIYVSRLDEALTFNGARELAEMIAVSEDAQSAFVTRLFQHMVKQPVGAYGEDRLETLRKHFVDSGFSVQSLLHEIAKVVATEPIGQSLAGL